MRMASVAGSLTFARDESWHRGTLLACERLQHLRGGWGRAYPTSPRRVHDKGDGSGAKRKHALEALDHVAAEVAASRRVAIKPWSNSRVGLSSTTFALTSSAGRSSTGSPAASPGSVGSCLGALHERSRTI